jgi:DeoR/GlpR family transcriptional regulator of sugar metabolism
MAEKHAEERYAHLLDLLSRQPIASVDDIRNATGASTATIRRDLTLLESRGLIRRVRGGASLVAASSDLDDTFELRRRRHAREKGTIAVLAASVIEPRSSLFLNDGSTALAVAEELIARAQPVWVATSGLNIGERLATVAGMEVVVIGGTLHGSSFGTSGPLATAALSQLSADAALLGCDGLDFELGPRWNSLLDAEVAAVMGRQARRVIVLADGSKVGNVGRAGTLGWSDVDLVVTNKLDATWRELLRDHNVEVLETE